MKTFSVVFSVALLVLAQQLGARLRRAKLLPVARGEAAPAQHHGIKVSSTAAEPSFIRL